MYCKYLKKRVGYLYCKKQNIDTTLSQCNKCTLFEQTTPKEYKYTTKNKSVLKRIKTPLKQVSKKRQFVSKETYESVFARDKGQCQLCGSRENLHLHHINSRGVDKTNNIDLCIMLCNHCHLEVVHKNNKYWRPKLIEFITNQKNN